MMLRKVKEDEALDKQAYERLSKFALENAGYDDVSLVTPQGFKHGVYHCIIEGHPPLPNGKYEPVLWQWVMENLSAGNIRVLQKKVFLEQFELFMTQAKATRVFFTNRPLRVYKAYFDPNMAVDDYVHAEPPFASMWIESSEAHRELFRYCQDSDMVKMSSGFGSEESPVIGFWTIKVSNSLTRTMYVSLCEDYVIVFMVMARDEVGTLHCTRVHWAALEPFLSSGWSTDSMANYSDKRQRIDKRYRKYISHFNPVTVIDCERSIGIPQVHRTGQREYSHQWPVRGFYRRLRDPDALGLNSEGERVVPGKTWVHEHTKGPKDKPMRDKRWRIKL